MLTPVDLDRVERDLADTPIAIRLIDVWWRGAIQRDTWDAWHEVWLILFGASIADVTEHHGDYAILMSVVNFHQSSCLETKHGDAA